ncbi:MAG: 1-acyl-sn-glycerol-3-phosphate acyltransferase [Sulfurimonas sp.]|jgi:1-acyl-sn-glycerol-3-phosphate acyltransferase
MVSVEQLLKNEHPSIFTYPNIVSKSIVGFTRFLIHENSINRFMQLHETKTGLEFIDAVLKHLNVSYKVIHREIENIPALGKVIIIANHPLGALDALTLIQMVCSVRQDKKVKVVANKILSSIPQLKDFLISVDNINDKLSKNSLRQIDTALQAEEAVIFFPSGEVSRAGIFGLKEGNWKGGFVKFAKRNSTPILPVFIKARNSWLFYTSSWIYKPLGALLLSHEIFAARNQIFDFKVGELIAYKAFNDSAMSEKYHAKLFRKHLIRLSKGKIAILHELGRSFVQPKYWGSRALDYLWQGIGAYLSHNPQIKYMIGPVSISGNFSKSAQNALVYFYNHYFGSDHTMVQAKSPYLLSEFVQAEFINLFKGDDYNEDFIRLKNYLKTFDLSVPTLYKQYTELCDEGGVQFIDFGIDVDFNNCIDGYIVVDIQKIKEVKRQRYMRER